MESVEQTQAGDIGSSFIPMDETLECDAPVASGGVAVTKQRGSEVGRYVILSTLGSGAMAVVYSAYDPELDRKVAIKLLKQRRVDEAIEGELMQREAQALARLQHPNVVAVHDIGVHEGAVFLAMEQVEGQTLLDWCHEKPRDWDAIVEMFVQAGRGLAAAHAQGLVHRDFKPTNVMVDREGRARVMDFGLAQEFARPAQTEERLGPDESGIAEVRGSTGSQTSSLGGVTGTPAYMAPEQFLGEDADARTDQFSFCVALYEALYGERPFFGDSVVNLVIAVTEGELPESPRGSAVPGWLRKRVLRGLARDPDARWPSMDVLLRELQTDPGARRRRWGVLAGVLAAATLGGYALSQGPTTPPACAAVDEPMGAVWNEDARERVRARIARATPSHAEATARAVVDALDDYADAWVDQRRDACEATQVRHEQSAEAMDLRMACLDARLDHFAAAVDVLGDADDAVTNKAIETVASLPGLDRCADTRALRARVAPPEDLEVAREVESLEQRLAHAAVLEAAGRYDAGGSEAAAVVEASSALDYPPLTARALARRGTLEQAAGDYTGAEATLKQAHFAAVRLADDELAAHTAWSLVDVIGGDLERHADARGWAEHARAYAERLDDPVALARVEASLGTIAFHEGDFETAQALHASALSTREGVLGDAHLDVAASLNVLGVLANVRGDVETAERHLLRAIEVGEGVLGEDHPRLAGYYNNLGRVAESAGDFDKALGLYERSLGIRERALGKDHPSVANSLGNLGFVALRAREFDDARAYYARALQLREHNLGVDHPDVAGSLLDLGNLAMAERDDEAAAAYYERALTIQERVLAPDHVDVAATLENLAAIAMRSRDYDLAVEHLERAIAIVTAALGEGPDAAHLFAELGDAVHQQSKYAEALELHRRALLAYGPDGPADPFDEVQPLLGQGASLTELGRADEALPLLERALELANDPADPARSAGAARLLGAALWEASADGGRDRERALRLVRRASVDGSPYERGEAEAWLGSR